MKEEVKNYGIIREQGESMQPVPLTAEENATVNASDSQSDNE